MTILAVTYWQVGLAVIVVIAVAAFLTGALKRRRGDVWHEFAKRRGLSFTKHADTPRVTGQVNGHEVSVAIDDASSDGDVGGVAVVRMSVGLENAPPGMTAEDERGLIGDLAVLAEDRIEFNEEEFNRNALVKGDETRAKAYWNQPRQRVFLALMEAAPCDQVAIRDGTLIAELREIVSDVDRLEQLLDQLLDAAVKLDEPTSAGDG